LQLNYYEVPLAYNINQPTKPKAWNSEVYPISVFGFIEFFKINAKNISTSLLCMADYIRSRNVKKSSINDILELKSFDKAA